MYEDLGNTDFNRAMNRAAGILGTYRSQEMRKISAYKGRESARRPTNDDDWRIALETKQGTQITSTSQGQAGRARLDKVVAPGKRRRSNTRSPGRGRGNSPTPGPSRGRGAYRGRGRGRGGPPPSSNQEQALLSALRAFLHK